MFLAYPVGSRMHGHALWAALGFTRLLAAAEDAALDTPAAPHLPVSAPQHLNPFVPMRE